MGIAGPWRDFGRTTDTSGKTVGFAGSDGCKDDLADPAVFSRSPVTLLLMELVDNVFGALP
jgi:hypothetical protein